MKKLVLSVLVAVVGMMALGTGGCATPAYTTEENVARTLRTWDFDSKQAMEDFLYETMMWPPSHGTLWNLR